MMAILFMIVWGYAMNNNLLYDFNNAETFHNWRIINDGVMGGLSTSKFELDAVGTAKFSGNVSPDNNGGFASVRTNLLNDIKVDYTGVSIRVKGDGKIYNLRFRTNNNFDGMAYQSKFRTIEHVWKEIKIPFENFKPTFRGRTIYNQPELNSTDIKQVGILIADKQFGQFTVDIDWIKFY